jgi:hypothetical protein
VVTIVAAGIAVPSAVSADPELLTVSPSPVAVGQDVTLSGHDCGAGAYTVPQPTTPQPTTPHGTARARAEKRRVVIVVTGLKHLTCKACEGRVTSPVARPSVHGEHCDASLDDCLAVQYVAGHDQDRGRPMRRAGRPVSSLTSA